MAVRQGRSSRTRQSYSYKSEYIEGNTVRKLAEPQRVPRRRTTPSKRQKTRGEAIKRTSWDLVSLLFMVAALSVTMYICVSYLRVQHDVVTLDKKIASVESEIMALKEKNDAAYSRIDTSVDLAYIYKVATEELGMVHPVENQVFSYKNQKSDYVRQYADIPEENR
jgi:cell division protein FtsL